uniref:Uncharacterized protein n=1 Tax=Romanomermis culicivorax TaxID=13658 RepID=A0A915JVT2_ROMCU
MDAEPTTPSIAPMVTSQPSTAPTSAAPTT